MEKMHPHETILESRLYKGIPVTLVKWAESVWCGKVGYAANNTDEPDVEKIADDAKLIFPNNTRKGREENWEVCISFNYLSTERPSGVMFGCFVESEEQPDCFDVVKVPEALYMRMEICNETSEALGVEPWMGGIPPYEWIGEHAGPALGYTYGEDTLPIVEYYKHDPVTCGIEACYLYVPVKAM